MQAFPSSRRRWHLLLVRPSTRALLLLVVFVALGLGWVVHRAHSQRDAVAAIKRAGAGVWYDWQCTNGIRDENGKPPVPRWLADFVGADYFGDAVYVISQTRKTVDSVLIPIGRLKRLERLDLFDSAVTDAGLAHLKGLNCLQTLDLSATDIGDTGLAHLEGLTDLKELDLRSTKVTDGGLVHLRTLRNLQALYLCGTQVSDAGLAYINHLTNLQELNLIGTHVSDAGVVHLKTLPKLKFLCLGGTEVGDEGLKHLRSMASLRVLDLYSEEPNTRLTPAGVSELQRALPNVRIEY